jgi:hypothetical protein
VASFTVTTAPWPAGTLVSAYFNEAWVDPTRSPTGPVVASGTVTSSGTVVFSGLGQRRRYVAYALGQGVRFLVPDVARRATPDRQRIDDLEEGATTAAETAASSALTSAERQVWAALAEDLLVGDILIHAASGVARFGQMPWPDGSLGTFIAKTLSHSNTLIDRYTVSFRPFAAPAGVATWRATEGFAALSDAEAATQVVRAAEVLSANAARNAYVPTDADLAMFYGARHALADDPTENPYLLWVTGRPGIEDPTTDELIQWTSWKWGIPTDRVRAQMVQESGWSMDFLGDLTTQPDEAHYLAAPEFARVASTLNAYESLGISQLRWFPDKVGNSNPHPGTEPLRWASTAFNLDYYGAVVRFYFDDPDGRRAAWGDETYAPGDEWLAQGGWYLPYPWNNAGQQSYVAAVQARLSARQWVLAEFSDVLEDLVLLTQPTITRAENGKPITRPPIVEGDYEAPDPPSAPLNPEATAGDGAVTLDWDAPASDGGAPVLRYRMTNVEFGWSLDTDYEAQHPYTLSGLEQGVPVSFNIRAIGATGEVGAASANTAQVTPMAPSAPDAPTGLTGTSGNNRVSLSWTAPVFNGGSSITSYQITPYIAGVAQTAINTGTSGTSYSVTGLTNGTAYTFTVAAENSVGVGTASSASSAVTPATPPGLEVPAETFLLSDGATTATSNEDFRPAANLTRPPSPPPATLAGLSWRSVTVPTSLAPQWGAVRLSSTSGDLDAAALNILSPGQPRFSPTGTLGSTGGAASNYTTLMRNYTIQAHASTGSIPSDADGGWVTLETVTDNRRASRLHPGLDLTAYAGGWIKVRVTASSGTGGNDDVAFRCRACHCSSHACTSAASQSSTRLPTFLTVLIGLGNSLRSRQRCRVERGMGWRALPCRSLAASRRISATVMMLRTSMVRTRCGRLWPQTWQ